MANPQQPELRRSEQIPALSPDASEAELEARRQRKRPSNPQVESPQSGNHSTHREPSGERAPDQPDPDAVAEQFGILPEQPGDEGNPNGSGSG